MKLYMFLPVLSLCVLVACTQYGSVAESPDRLAIVPYPSLIEKQTGTINLNDEMLILASPNGSVQKTAALLAGYIKDAGGPSLPVKPLAGARPKDAVVLALEPNAPAGRESYTLEIGKDGILLRAREPEGIFRGTQTLRQMLLAAKAAGEKKLSLPCASITDTPRFSWRGLNLDCSRHFYTIKDIKRYLDLMALYKMNVFHWNLVNDQGWRLEIKKYPKLTTVGAWRNEGGKKES